MTVLHSYQGKQPDELNLDIGDVVNVTRKMADGEYLFLYSKWRLLCLKNLTGVIDNVFN